MKLIGAGEVFDSREEKTLTERLFEFDIKRGDYFFQFFTQWQRVVCDYEFEIGRHRFILPSGVYVLLGFIDGQTDWVMVDEIINMDVDVVHMSTDFNAISLDPPKLTGLKSTVCTLPFTKNVLPITDVTGQRCILITFKDYHSRLKKYELQDYCAI